MRMLRDRLARLDGAPVALVAALAAAAAFVSALLVGWATAGTREQLQSAAREERPAAPAVLVVLGAAAPLPSAPPKRRAAKRPRAPRRATPLPPVLSTTPVPKLLSGTG